MLHFIPVPNFPPLRRYVFSVVDRWIARRGLKPPFLEAGCGTGALAAHLAAKGWSGTALDSSPAAIAMAKLELARFPSVKVVEGDLNSLHERRFGCAFVMDVLEHVRDDEAMLAALASRLAEGGFLVLLVPVNPEEWAADDVIYGHFRRYGWQEVEARLGRAGLKLVESWNVTVPCMWLLRRIYLRFLPGPRDPGPRDTLTAASSFYNPWDGNGVLSWLGMAAGLAFRWFPLFGLQDLFSSSRRGHAAMFLAVRGRESQPQPRSRS